MLVGSISSSGGDSVIGSCTDVSDCSACDAVLFSVAVGFFFCGAGFGFGGGLFGFRRSRTVSSRSLFFFLSSSRIAGRSPFGIEASATICSSVALICPVRISSCAPGTASSAASMPREYFSARRKLAQFHVNSPFRSFSMLCSPISRKTVTASGRSCISLREQN